MSYMFENKQEEQQKQLESEKENKNFPLNGSFKYGGGDDSSEYDDDEKTAPGTDGHRISSAWGKRIARAARTRQTA